LIPYDDAFDEPSTADDPFADRSGTSQGTLDRMSIDTNQMSEYLSKA